MLRVLLLSDLHAISGDPDTVTSPSHLSARPTYDSATLNPLRAIPDMLRKESLCVDWVLCPGDLGDRADPVAQRFAWESLERLRAEVGATRLVGTAGNHDVDSRLKYDDYDPKGNLQSLKPPFPGLDEISVDRYWSRNFAILNDGDVRLVILNSAAFHGVYSDDASVKRPAEYLHGRVSDRTIDAIEASLDGSDAKLNILMTHHHIIANEEFYRTAGNDVMRGGQLLLKRLYEKTGHRWVVIHGHQHFPDVRYGGTGSPPPVIFSAGSVSAKLSPDIFYRATNQFYYLEFPIHRYETLGWEGCATVRSWHWIKGTGWLPTPLDFKAGIPSGSGFGCIVSPRDIARQMASAFRSSGQSTLRYAEMCGFVPVLEFMLSADLQATFAACLKEFGIRHFVDPSDPQGSRTFIQGAPDGA
jgi:hypothetical protein